MADQKPIKLDLVAGMLSQFTVTDTVDEQFVPGIEHLKCAFAQMVLELIEMGFEFKSELVTGYLKYID